MSCENTQDLSKFGYIEIREAARLLNAYVETEIDILNDEIHIEFNPNSGSVFLVDSDYNVAMMNGDKLESWYNCPYCGHEGFKEYMKHDPKDDECTRYMEEIGLIQKKTCEVCNEILVVDNGYMSCPVYMAGVDKASDEHTSIEIKEEP